MSLASGTQLGPYEIIEPLGAGGMGEVYKARDTRLDREVAIKVLPEHLSENEELKQRFEREARAISQLSHPHICALHDIGCEGGVDFLVMELVEGESLGERLERGPMPAAEVLRAGSEIAQALDRAHRQGVVHRDLKPGNVMLTRMGVKLLDFGLAKIADPDAVEEGLSQLATEAQAMPLTEAGTILGTFSYMAPEQLEGRDADPRSDIFALGVVLFEMTTGRRAFGGESRASVIAAVLKEQPPSVSTLQPLTPPALDHIITRCLAKDPEDRWQSAQDVAGQLEWISQEGSQAGIPAPVAGRRKSRERLAWGIAATALIGCVLSLASWVGGRTEPQTLHAQIAAPRATRFLFQGDFGLPAVLSPDGTRVAFGAVDEEGDRSIWIRSLEDGMVRKLEGTSGAFAAFWSADGRSLAFYFENQLRRVDVAGSPPRMLATAPGGRGGAWPSNGLIIFAPDFRSALWSIREAGGEARQLTQIDTSRHTSHRWPTHVPGTPYVLYSAVTHEGSAEDHELRIVHSETGEDRFVMRSVANGVVADGHLLFLRESTLMARPFDPASAELSGEEKVVGQNVLYDATTWRGTFTAARDRLLLSPGGYSAGSQLIWYDKNGGVLGSLGERGHYGDISLSPDGTKVAYGTMRPQDIWLTDLERGVATRLSFDNAIFEAAPIWSPDGRDIFYTAYAGFALGDEDKVGSRLFRRAASGSGAEELIYEGKEFDFVPRSVSPDGKFMLLTRGILPFTLDADLVLLALDGESDPVELATTPFVDSDARFSPDGRWIAYDSNESGRFEIYVTPFEPEKPWLSGGRWQVSTDSGVLPRWSHDGTALFFLGENLRAYRAEVDPSGEGFGVGVVEPMFSTTALTDYAGWDVTPDGERFLINSHGEAQSEPLELVIGWRAMLDEKR